MDIAKVFLGLNAAGIGLIGLAYLINPNFLLAQYKLKAESAGMDSMLRGAYGGQFLGMAAIFACGALLPNRAADALLFTMLFMGGFALGRLASLIRKGSPGGAIGGLLAYEIITTSLAAALYSGWIA